MNTYLFIAYSTFMLILFAYFFLISNRTKKVEEKISELEMLIEEIKKGGKES